MNTMNPVDVLDLTVGDNDADAETIRDYLIKLLSAVWREGEGFSGKRPFGNSSWEYELYRPLVRAGLIEGEFEVYDGETLDGLESVDYEAGDRIISQAINALTMQPIPLGWIELSVDDIRSGIIDQSILVSGATTRQIQIASAINLRAVCDKADQDGVTNILVALIPAGVA